MEKETKACKQACLKFFCFSFVFCLTFLLVSPCLFSASITNEGDTIVKINGRSSKGILGAASIQPGQTFPIKQSTEWIEHVPTGASSQVRLKIVENNGQIGYIDTSGGRYTFQRPSEQKVVVAEKKKMSSGSAANHSNVAMSLNFVGPNSTQSFLVLRPGEKCEIPADTVQVRTDQYGWASGDSQISVSVIMPDGSERVIRTSHAVIGIDSNIKE